MPRTCTVCRSPRVDEINHALLANEPYRDIARRCSLSPAAVLRHKEHIPLAVVKAKKAGEALQGDDLLRSIRSLHERTMRILDDAEAAGDRTNALRAVQQARGNIELLGRLLGELEASSPTSTKIEIIYIDQTLNRTMTEGIAPKLIEATPESP